MVGNMRFFKVAAAAIFAMLVFAVPASATIAHTTGPLAGAPGQNSNNDVVAFLNAYLHVSDVIYVGKLEGNGTVENLNSILANEGVTLSGTGLTGKFGTWTFNQGTSTYEIIAIQVAGGSHAATYLLTPPALTGDWNTLDILAGASSNHPDLSHLEFYARKITTRAPEPASLLLFGAGLAGIRLRSRKRAA